MPNVYFLYGFVAESDAPLPGIAPASSYDPVDLRVVWGAMPPWLGSALETAEIWYASSFPDAEGEPTLTIWKLLGGQYFRLAYTDGVEFVLDAAGAAVWAIWPEAQSPEDAATYLLGPVMSIILLFRGILALHASAIAIGDRAIALVGDTGAGKSTTAAAFARLGYKICGDDVAALDERPDGPGGGDGFWVRPAYPHIRLWPDAVRALYGSEEALPKLTPTWDKRYLDLNRNPEGFHNQPLRLAAIYLLGDRRDDPAAPFVEAVNLQEGLVHLIANTYTAFIHDKPMRTLEFETWGRLIATVPVRRVIPHTDIIGLPALCQVILHDLQKLKSDRPF